MKIKDPEKSSLDLRARKEPYLENCRSKEMVFNKVYECHITNPPCEYFTNFGNAKFCNHPLKSEIAKRANGNN
jgi:hypothetical protein